MTDGIIKGTGNSRYLKSVANAMTLYPTYEDFIAALVAGTFPVDLYGLNANGWQQKGTDLNKASLLTDAVESSIWGSAADRTVSAALQQLRSLISTAQSTASTAQNNRIRIAVGAYSGTGTEEQTISLPFTPKMVLILTNGTMMISNNWVYGGLAVAGQYAGSYSDYYAIKIVTNGFSVRYDQSRYISLNNGNRKLYVAIGGGANS